MKVLEVNEDFCLGCGACVIVCPVNCEVCPEIVGGNGPDSDDVVMLVENGVVTLLNPGSCIVCYKCNESCPTKAIYHREV